MCEHIESCVFYHARDNSKIRQLLKETYCEGELYEVCRRKKFEEEKGCVAIAELGPNGFSIEDQKRIY